MTGRTNPRSGRLSSRLVTVVAGLCVVFVAGLVLPGFRAHVQRWAAAVHLWDSTSDAVPDSGFGSSVGDPSAGGLAAAAGYFSTPSEMPGAVVEPLYLTDPFEASVAVTAADQAVVAGGIVSAVEQFLSPTAAARS